jgi:Mg2+/Co2+ transporter CorB
MVLSALTSGTETALTAASRARFHRLASEGDRRAALVIRGSGRSVRRRR